MAWQGNPNAFAAPVDLVAWSRAVPSFQMRATPWSTAEVDAGRASFYVWWSGFFAASPRESCHQNPVWLGCPEHPFVWAAIFPFSLQSDAGSPSVQSVPVHSGYGLANNTCAQDVYVLRFSVRASRSSYTWRGSVTHGARVCDAFYLPNFLSVQSKDMSISGQAYRVEYKDVSLARLGRRRSSWLLSTDSWKWSSISSEWVVHMAQRTR